MPQDSGMKTSRKEHEEAEERSAKAFQKAVGRLSVKDAGHRSTYSDYSKRQARKRKARRR
jgi:hypothetical protein